MFNVRVITSNEKSDKPYLIRITLLSLFGFNIYLHVILRSDDDRALHDHPWPFVSIILSGGYLEYMAGNSSVWRGPGSILFRQAEFAHRVELPQIRHEAPLPSLSLVFTGRRWRKWGFHCPQGWVHWKAFVNRSSGCGDEYGISVVGHRISLTERILSWTRIL